MAPHPPDPALPLACELLRKFEGLRLVAYADAGYGWSCPTIGYGATGPAIKRDTVWTREQAEADLERRVVEMLRFVRQASHVPLTPGMAAALCSFAYNVGGKALSDSTLLRRLNGGDFTSAADEFLRWDKSNGRVLKALINRRAEERRVFLAALPSSEVATS